MMRAIPTLLISLLTLDATGSGREPVEDDVGTVESDKEIAAAAPLKKGLTLLVRVGDGRWSGKRAVSPLRGQEIALKVKGSGLEDIRWYMIFADLTRNYKNANHPWEANPYQWVGFDEIRYHRVELRDLRGHDTIHPFADGRELWRDVKRWFEANGAGGSALEFYNEGRGSFWFQATATKRGGRYRSPGIEDATDRGLPRSVTRISIRDREGYLGHISTFFNVPGLFGSVLSQSRHHIGADCADVLMAAWAGWRRRPLEKNYNVQMMTRKFKRKRDVEIVEGRPDEIIRWSEHVHPGDIIAVSYGGEKKRFHHVGALYEDVNGDGILGPEDTVIHAGPDPLHVSSLESGAFDGRVLILEP